MAKIWLIVPLIFALTACGGAESKKAIGTTCAASGECDSGLCGGGQCLDPASDDDLDGLINELEVNVLGTDPTLADTDGDGTRDGDEVVNATGVDTDGDGKDDALESATADQDGDCIPDQYDAEDGVDNSDLSPLVAVVCRQEGVCGESIADLRVDCPDSTKVAVCDYGLVEGYEAPETSCDQRDNDCDGATDEDAAQADCVAELIGLALNPTTLTLVAGEDGTLVATGTYDDASSAAISDQVTWTSDTPSVATVAADGTVTARAAGRATVSAAIGDLSSSATVTVTARPRALRTIALSPDPATTPLGVDVALTATGTYDDNTTADLTPTATWASSVPAVATIAAGTAHPLTTGQTVLTATVGQVTGSAQLTVSAAIVASVALGPTGLVVPNGTTAQLTATASYSDGTTADIAQALTWSSSASERATIAGGGLLTAHATGAVTVTATDGDQNWTLAVAIGGPIATGLRIEPATPEVGVERTLQLAAIAAMSDETEEDVTDQVTWESEADAIATVDAAGVATGVADGEVVISATFGEVEGVATLTVFIPIPLPLVVSGTPLRVVAPGAERLVALGSVRSQVPVRTIVVESTQPGIDGAGGVNALSVVHSRPPVRTIVIESTQPGIDGGGGINALTTVTSRPPVRATVVESEDLAANPTLVIGRPPTKVTWP